MMGSRGSKTPRGIDDFCGSIEGSDADQCAQPLDFADVSDDRYERTGLTDGAPSVWSEGGCCTHDLMPSFPQCS
jgi:hypothetical protein